MPRRKETFGTSSCDAAKHALEEPGFKDRVTAATNTRQQ